jgi:rhodanese-related sulfurtransferase
VTTLDEHLAGARAEIERVSPNEAARRQRDGALLVDTRPVAQRATDGEIPGALVIERNVLEWRLAPSSEWRIPELRDAEQEVIIVCNEGFASSLAAATLRRLGLTNATDLAGGFVAWRDAGLPVRPLSL